MAGTAVTVTPEFSTSPESVVERLRASHNLVVDDLETVRGADAESNTLIGELHDDHATFKTVTDDLKTLANALRTYLSNGLLVHGALAISATPEDFKTTATAVYTIAGVTYTKAATDGLSFSAAHVITATKFGVVLVQIDAAGTVTTKVPADPQAYDTAEDALAALPAVDAGNVSLGYIAIEAGVADWDANTDDMTNASDVTTAAFNNTQVKAIPSAVSSSAPATLTAGKPTATAVDAAGDLLAYKVNLRS